MSTLFPVYTIIISYAITVKFPDWLKAAAYIFLSK